jgi:hypothetical protein
LPPERRTTSPGFGFGSGLRFGVALRGLAAFAALRLGAAVFAGLLGVFLPAAARFLVGDLLIGPSFERIFEAMGF